MTVPKRTHELRSAMATVVDAVPGPRADGTHELRVETRCGGWVWGRGAPRTGLPPELRCEPHGRENDNLPLMAKTQRHGVCRPQLSKSGYFGSSLETQRTGAPRLG